MELAKQLVVHLLLLLLGCALAFSTADEDVAQKTNTRKGKIFSVFNVVRFPNAACNVTGNTQTGTCYTAAECEERDGAGSTACANGFGVCCIFSVTCGDTSRENCTYFDSIGTETGECSVNICRCSDNICQLRLDFSQFMITGPSTSTLVVGKLIGNTLNPVGAVVGNSVTSASQCITDSFSVTNPGGSAPPVICGNNMGEHIYVDASEDCNMLNFQLSAMVTTTTRRWSIKVTQYSCDFNNLAPSGCTQFFFGPMTTAAMRVVRTFNFAGGAHLADQNQNICVRREAGNCRICWFTAVATDFSVSASTLMAGFSSTSLCCGFGTLGVPTSQMAYDCANFGPAVTNGATSTLIIPSRYCGRSGVNTGDTNIVCSTSIPFSVRFLSNFFEVAGAMQEAANPTKGFMLSYTMDAISC